MPEPQTEAVAVVLAPHPALVLVLCSHPSGRFAMYRVPVFIDVQVYVDWWFDARRNVVAGQMEAKDDG